MLRWGREDRLKCPAHPKYPFTKSPTPTGTQPVRRRHRTRTSGPNASPGAWGGVLKYFLSAGSQPPARAGDLRILTPVSSLSSRSTEPEEAEAILETEQRLEKIRQSLQQKESQELEQLRYRQAEAEQELEELKRRREERRRVREGEERRREEEEQQRLAKEEVPD